MIAMWRFTMIRKRPERLLQNGRDSRTSAG
jgi:hypothetical protein